MASGDFRLPHLCPITVTQASELQIHGIPRCGEYLGNPSVGLDPCTPARRDPRGDLQDFPVVLLEMPGKDRLVMRDPVPERSEGVQRRVDVPA